MVYAAPLAVALAAVLGQRYYFAAALFGVAISIKLQAVFLFPLLGIWAIRRELPLRALLLVPATYLATLVPAWLAGCSWADLLTIYAKQAQQYSGPFLTFFKYGIFACAFLWQSRHAPIVKGLTCAIFTI